MSRKAAGLKVPAAGWEMAPAIGQEDIYATQNHRYGLAWDAQPDLRPPATAAGDRQHHLAQGAAVGSDDDVLSIDSTNNAALAIVGYLDRIGELTAGSVTISEPSMVVSSGEARSLDEEGNEAVWEEIGVVMRRESNPSSNYLLMMILSGAVAAFGLVADTLHIVVGAMLIAPGFAPLLRRHRQLLECRAQ